MALSVLLSVYILILKNKIIGLKETNSLIIILAIGVLSGWLAGNNWVKLTLKSGATYPKYCKQSEAFKGDDYATHYDY